MSFYHTDSYGQQRTCHTAELTLMNLTLSDIMRVPHQDAPPYRFKDSLLPIGDSVMPARMAGLMMATALTLLQGHDDTGISLDAWAGPTQLVQDALELVGIPKNNLLPNGV